jgi:hypothetical protein
MNQEKKQVRWLDMQGSPNENEQETEPWDTRNTQGSVAEKDPHRPGLFDTDLFDPDLFNTDLRTEKDPHRPGLFDTDLRTEKSQASPAFLDMQEGESEYEADENREPQPQQSEPHPNDPTTFFAPPKPTLHPLEPSTYKVAKVSTNDIVLALYETLTSECRPRGHITFETLNRLGFDWHRGDFDYQPYYNGKGRGGSRGTCARVNIYRDTDQRHAVEVQRRCGDRKAFMRLWRRIRAALGALETQALAQAGFVPIVFSYGRLLHARFDFPVQRVSAMVYGFAQGEHEQHAVVRAGGCLRGELLCVRLRDAMKLLRTCDAKEGLLPRTRVALAAMAPRVAAATAVRVPGEDLPVELAAAPNGRLVQALVAPPSALPDDVQAAAEGLYSRSRVTWYKWGWMGQGLAVMYHK